MPTDLYHLASQHSLLPELDEACCLNAVFQARSIPSHVRLFVNVLPTALAGEELGATTLAAALERSELPPERFVLELTESVPLPGTEILTRGLQEYRRLGAAIAIDDYGMGFANLASLVAIRPEFLKLDRCLTAGLPDDPLRQEILRAMRTITESYGAAVIAEGIESPEQLSKLLELGVPYGQGELLAGPSATFGEISWPL
jgi:EAL domain-containing protein (putative c-di-GMP-specific phosphodiesterase class I)